MPDLPGSLTLSPCFGAGVVYFNIRLEIQQSDIYSHSQTSHEIHKLKPKPEMPYRTSRSTAGSNTACYLHLACFQKMSSLLLI